MYTLQTCLTNMMGRPITMDQLQQDVGLMVEKITYVTLMFRRVRLRMEEYVCLKVITMLSQGKYFHLTIHRPTPPKKMHKYRTCLFLSPFSFFFLFFFFFFLFLVPYRDIQDIKKCILFLLMLQLAKQNVSLRVNRTLEC